jgi:hypothetical protein
MRKKENKGNLTYEKKKLRNKEKIEELRSKILRKE